MRKYFSIHNKISNENMAKTLKTHTFEMVSSVFLLTTALHGAIKFGNVFLNIAENVRCEFCTRNAIFYYTAVTHNSFAHRTRLKPYSRTLILPSLLPSSSSSAYVRIRIDVCACMRESRQTPRFAVTVYARVSKCVYL